MYSMKIFHGTDKYNFKLQKVKDGVGYHPSAGPVEFLGLSYSDSRNVAGSYGEKIIESDFTPKNPKKFRSLNALKNDILKTFGLPSGKLNLGEHYKDIADSYRAKLLAEGYDSILFPEGLKSSTDLEVATTVIPLAEEFYNQIVQG